MIGYDDVCVMFDILFKLGYLLLSYGAWCMVHQTPKKVFQFSV